MPDGRTAAAHESFTILDTSSARLVGVKPAADVVEGLSPRHFLHAGPPLELGLAPGPLRGALVAGLMFEGEADTVEAAEQIINRGDLQISSGSDAGGVGPVAGVVTPSMPVVVVESSRGTSAFSPLNEGRGRVMRFGANDDATVRRLQWMRDELAPVLDDAIARVDDIDITVLLAEALRRGDEVHNRNTGVSAAFLLSLAPQIVRSAERLSKDAAEILEWSGRNPQFFLPFAMAAAKAITRATADIPNCPVVSAVAANGVEIGIQVSGCGDRWFTAASPLGRPKVFDGYSVDDAQPALGDSFVTEVFGLGACALTAAPAVHSALGITAAEAADIVGAMREVCVGSSSRFLLPADSYAGTPVGIDVSKVVASRTPPVVEYGLAHRVAGVGQLGAGLTELPLSLFDDAAQALGI